MKYKIGDKVRTKPYNYIGTIVDTHLVCPMDSNWLALQESPIRRSNRVNWYTINTEPNGQIAVPEYMVNLQMCSIDYYGNRTYL